MKDYITIIGGGLAGCEAAYQIAKRGIKVKLYEMKPQKFSPAHTNKNLAEVVCSNSFKSNLHTNACGLLKEELRILDSLLIKIADETSVPAGQALAVDREVFSKRVTEELEKMENIEIIRKEIGNEAITDKNELENMASDGIVIIATGPLTSDNLSNEILKITGQDKLFFYDAAAPIIEKDSIDMNIAFWGERYEQEREKEEDIEKWTERIKTQNEASYLNLPMNKEEYEKFWNDLVNAEVVTLHDFEKREIIINKTIHYSKASSPVEGSKFFYTTAKTISSNRVIPMTDEVYEILQNQKIKQTEQKMWKRSIWKQHKEFQNLVFTCSDGSPVYYYNVNSAIKDYVAKINVIEIELAKEEKREPKIFELFTCHTLRHTYATRCYENGVDQQVVQKLLGHSTLAMTTDLYTHVSEEKKKEEVAELKILA